MIIKPTTPKIYTPQDRSCVLNLSGRDVRGSQIYDRSGKGNHGAIIGAVLKPSNYGLPVLSFDGVNDYVDAGKAASLNIEGTNPFSFSIWVKQIGNGASASPRILYKERWVSSADRGGWLVNLKNDGVLSFAVINNASFPSSTATILKNIWYHVIGTYDGTQQKLYVDGVLKDTDANTVGSGTHSTKILTIGSAGGYTNTLIDEVLIYNRAILQQAIIEYFNRTKHLYGK